VGLAAKDVSTFTLRRQLRGGSTPQALKRRCICDGLMARINSCPSRSLRFPVPASWFLCFLVPAFWFLLSGSCFLVFALVPALVPAFWFYAVSFSRVSVQSTGKRKGATSGRAFGIFTLYLNYSDWEGVKWTVGWIIYLSYLVRLRFTRVISAY
jgi:hypothetical protein